MGIIILKNKEGWRVYWSDDAGLAWEYSTIEGVLKKAKALLEKE